MFHRMQGARIEIFAYEFYDFRPVLAFGFRIRELFVPGYVPYNPSNFRFQELVDRLEAMCQHTSPHPKRIRGSQVGLDDDTISLSRKNVEAMERLGMNVCSIDFGDMKGMFVQLELEFSKGTNIDDA